MSLPLTLAVLDGMVVKVADQTLVVPLTAIVETLQPKKRRGAWRSAPDARVIGIRGGFAPLIDVGQELGYPHDAAPTRSAASSLLIETEGGARSALLVDAIQDQRQVVIKSLEANYGQVRRHRRRDDPRRRARRADPRRRRHRRPPPIAAPCPSPFLRRQVERS